MQRIPAVTPSRRSPAALRPRTAKPAAGLRVNRPHGRSHEPGPPGDRRRVHARRDRQPPPTCDRAAARRAAARDGGRGAGLGPVPVGAAHGTAQRTRTRGRRGQRRRHVLQGGARRSAGDRRRALGRQPQHRRDSRLLRAAPAGARPRRSTQGSAAGSTSRPRPRVRGRRGAVARHPDLSGRSYAWHVLATEAPYVSERLESRLDGGRVIVMAVPTRDAGGHMTGVLAAAV